MKLQNLVEGGWSSTVTQSVQLTPKLVKRALHLLPDFEEKLNAYLDKLELPAVSISHPVGSTSYVDRDMDEHPDKEYGDIDVMIELQPILGMSESKAASIYQKAIADFIKSESPGYVYRHEGSGQNVIFNVGKDEYVQVDLVKTFTDSAEWARYRTTPEYGIKGALIGFLYSALAEALHLSIGQMGVQVKRKGGAIVPFRTLKPDQVVTISREFEQFGEHIARWLVKELKPDGRFEMHPLLKAQPGMKKSEVTVRDLANVVKGVAKTLELNGVLGLGHLSHYKDAADLVDTVQRIYLEKNADAATASKFDKAETEAAKLKAQATKELLLTKSKELARLLDL
jgi:hypothetical protein